MFPGLSGAPRSSKTTLAIQSAGVDPIEHATEAIWTSLPAFLLALAGFIAWLLRGVGMAMDEADDEFCAEEGGQPRWAR